MVALALAAPSWLGTVEAADFGARNLKGVRVCTDEASVQARDTTDLQRALLTAIRVRLRDGSVTTVEGACRARRDALHLLLDVEYQVAAGFSVEVVLFDRNPRGIWMPSRCMHPAASGAQGTRGCSWNSFWPILSSSSRTGEYRTGCRRID